MKPLQRLWFPRLPAISLLLLLAIPASTWAVPFQRKAGISENVYIIYSNDSASAGEERRVCEIDGVQYRKGESIPSSELCEECVCHPPGFACTITNCQHKSGCKAIQRSNQCCPEFKCECEKDGRIYQNGDKIVDLHNPCHVCFCQGGEVRCSEIQCYWRSDCKPRFLEHRCCPIYEHCPPIVPFNPATPLSIGKKPIGTLSPLVTMLGEAAAISSATTTSSSSAPTSEIPLPASRNPEEVPLPVSTASAPEVAFLSTSLKPQEIPVVPEEVTKVPESIPIPEEIATVLEQVAKGPEEVVTVPEEAAKVPEEVVPVPEGEKVPEEIVQVVTIPDVVKVPEEIVQVITLPEVANIPEEVITVPEDVKVPEEADKISEVVTVPEEVAKAPEVVTVPEAEKVQEEIDEVSEDVTVTKDVPEIPEEAVTIPEEAVTIPEEVVKIPEEPVKVSEEVTVPEVEKAPEVVTAPEETATAPKETTLAPEQVAKVPEAETEVPKEVEKAPEAVTKVPEAETEVPKEVEKAPEAVTTIPEEAITVPKEAVAQEVPNIPEEVVTILEVSKVPEEILIVPGDAMAAPVETDTVPEESVTEPSALQERVSIPEEKSTTTVIQDERKPTELPETSGIEEDKVQELVDFILDIGQLSLTTTQQSIIKDIIKDAVEGTEEGNIYLQTTVTQPQAEEKEAATENPNVLAEEPVVATNQNIKPEVPSTKESQKQPILVTEDVSTSGSHVGFATDVIPVDERLEQELLNGNEDKIIIEIGTSTSVTDGGKGAGDNGLVISIEVTSSPSTDSLLRDQESDTESEKTVDIKTEKEVLIISDKIDEVQISIAGDQNDEKDVPEVSELETEKNQADQVAPTGFDDIEKSPTEAPEEKELIVLLPPKKVVNSDSIANDALEPDTAEEEEDLPPTQYSEIKTEVGPEEIKETDVPTESTIQVEQPQSDSGLLNDPIESSTDASPTKSEISTIDDFETEVPPSDFKAFIEPHSDVEEVQPVKTEDATELYTEESEIAETSTQLAGVNVGRSEIEETSTQVAGEKEKVVGRSEELPPNEATNPKNAEKQAEEAETTTKSDAEDSHNSQFEERILKISDEANDKREIKEATTSTVDSTHRYDELEEIFRKERQSGEDTGADPEQDSQVTSEVSVAELSEIVDDQTEEGIQIFVKNDDGQWEQIPTTTETDQSVRDARHEGVQESVQSVPTTEVVETKTFESRDLLEADEDSAVATGIQDTTDNLKKEFQESPTEEPSEPSEKESETRYRSLDEKDATDAPEYKSSDEKDVTDVPKERSLDEKDATSAPENKSSDEKDVTDEPQQRSLDEKDATGAPEYKSSDEKDVTDVPQQRSLDEKDVTEEPQYRSVDEKDVTEEPQHNSPSEKDITSAPQYRSIADTNAPQHQSADEIYVTDELQYKSAEEKDVTIGYRSADVTDASRYRSADEKYITNKPQYISDEKDVTDEPQYRSADKKIATGTPQYRSSDEKDATDAPAEPVIAVRSEAIELEKEETTTVSQDDDVQIAVKSDTKEDENNNSQENVLIGEESAGTDAPKDEVLEVEETSTKPREAKLAEDDQKSPTTSSPEKFQFANDQVPDQPTDENLGTEAEPSENHTETSLEKEARLDLTNKMEATTEAKAVDDVDEIGRSDVKATEVPATEKSSTPLVETVSVVESQKVTQIDPVSPQSNQNDTSQTLLKGIGAVSILGDEPAHILSRSPRSLKKPPKNKKKVAASRLSTDKKPRLLDRVVRYISDTLSLF